MLHRATWGKRIRWAEHEIAQRLGHSGHARQAADLGGAKCAHTDRHAQGCVRWGGRPRGRRTLIGAGAPRDRAGRHNLCARARWGHSRDCVGGRGLGVSASHMHTRTHTQT